MSTEIYILVLTLSHLAAVCVGYRIMWKKAGKWDYSFKRFGTQARATEETFSISDRAYSETESDEFIQRYIADSEQPQKTNVEEVKCLDIKYSQREQLWELLKDHQGIIAIGDSTPQDTLFDISRFPHSFISQEGKLTGLTHFALFDSENFHTEQFLEIPTVEFDEFFERIKRLIE